MSAPPLVHAGPLDVLVVGSIHADLVVSVAVAPEAGWTVVAERVERAQGGKGANQAVAAARAGAVVAMVGCVGPDEEGRLACSALTAEQVDVRDVEVLGSHRTSAAVVLVDHRGENRVVVLPGASGHLPAALVATAMARQPSIVVCQGETPLPALLEAHRLAAATATRFALNLAPVVDVPDHMLADCDPLLLNEHELDELVGPGGGIESLRGRVRSAVVSRGAAGASVLDGSGTVVHVPAPEVDQVVDTTGAGDVLAGTVVAALARRRSLTEATGLAVDLASRSVRTLGARPGSVVPER